MKDLEFLKEITDVPGGSGDESLVREILRREISNVTKPQVDGIGNIYGMVGQGPKVLAVGHMDEIGFMVRQIDSKGQIKVGQVGFVFPWGITSQMYQIVTASGKIIEGVCSLNPDQIKSKMNEFPSPDDITIDVGCSSKKEVEELGIEVGNSVIAKSQFTIMNKNIVAKAWDNRIGCAISVKTLQNLDKDNLKVTFIGGGTVQEEVGCRGARALGVHIQPDIAFSLDTAPASNEEGSVVGKGPQIFVMDSGTIGNKKLLEHVKKIARANNIPFQLCYLRRGGTDASEFQNVSGGAPTLAIGVPVKYIHTPTSMIAYSDYFNATKLMIAVVESLNEEIVNEIKSF